MRKQESGFDVTTVEGLERHIGWLDSIINSDIEPKLNAKKALQKNEAFRAELRRHGIGWRLFQDCGHIRNASAFGNPIYIIMGKHKGAHGYQVCDIKDGKIISALGETDKQKLHQAAAEWESEMEFGNTPKYSVKVGRKYFYVCKNNGSFHKGDAGHLPGYATFVGRFGAESDTIGDKIDYQLSWIGEISADLSTDGPDNYKIEGGALKKIGTLEGVAITEIISDLDDLSLYENEQDIISCLEDWINGNWETATELDRED